jgi:hypothetical protein
MDSLPAVPSWRLLLLDRTEADDPRWLVATVESPDDVRPAELDDTGQPLAADFMAAIAFASDRAGKPAVLTSLPAARAWLIDGVTGGEADLPGSAR